MYYIFMYTQIKNIKSLCLAVILLVVSMVACDGYQDRRVGSNSGADPATVEEIIRQSEPADYFDQLIMARSVLTAWANSSTTPQSLISLPGLRSARLVSIVLTQVTPHFVVKGVNEAEFKLYIRLDQSELYTYRQQGPAQWSQRSFQVYMSSSTGHTISLLTRDLGYHQKELAPAVRFTILNASGQQIGHISSLARYDMR